jgi:hypothetical protein
LVAAATKRFAAAVPLKIAMRLDFPVSGAEAE